MTLAIRWSSARSRGALRPSQPRDYLGRVRVGGEYRIDAVSDPVAPDHQREPLEQHLAGDLEGGQPERSRELQARITQYRKRQVQAVHHFLLVIRGLGAQPEDPDVRGLELLVVI